MDRDSTAIWMIGQLVFDCRKGRGFSPGFFLTARSITARSLSIDSNGSFPERYVGRDTNLSLTSI